MYMFLLLVSSQDLNINVLYCVKILSSLSLCQITDYKFIKEMFSLCKFYQGRQSKKIHNLLSYIFCYILFGAYKK